MRAPHLTGTGLISCLGLANPIVSSGLSMLVSFDLVEEGGVSLDRSEVGVSSNAGLLRDCTVVGGVGLSFGCRRSTGAGPSECGGVVESGRGCNREEETRNVHMEGLHTYFT